MAEISSVLKDLFKPDVIKFGIRTRSIPQWIQAGLRKQNIAMVDFDDKDIIIEYKGCRFKVNAVTCYPVLTVYDEYRIDRIRKGDIVLDIGSQIGAFAIPASKIAKKVYTVEPLFGEELEENIRLNNADNIDCFNYAIHRQYEETTNLEYWGIKKKCDTVCLKALRWFTGPIDYIKIDCEGAEWNIRPEELEGIRTIEAELHTFNPFHVRNVKKWERWLSKDYDYELDRIDSTRYMLHAELR